MHEQANECKNRSTTQSIGEGRMKLICKSISQGNSTSTNAYSQDLIEPKKDWPTLLTKKINEVYGPEETTTQINAFKIWSMNWGRHVFWYRGITFPHAVRTLGLGEQLGIHSSVTRPALRGTLQVLWIYCGFPEKLGFTRSYLECRAKRKDYFREYRINQTLSHRNCWKLIT